MFCCFVFYALTVTNNDKLYIKMIVLTFKVRKVAIYSQDIIWNPWIGRFSNSKNKPAFSSFLWKSIFQNSALRRNLLFHFSPLLSPSYQPPRIYSRGRSVLESQARARPRNFEMGFRHRQTPLQPHTVVSTTVTRSSSSSSSSCFSRFSLSLCLLVTCPGARHPLSAAGGSCKRAIRESNR